MLSVVKRHKRLVVIDGDDRIVYCPPSFLKPFYRADLASVIVDGVVPLSTIMDFEDRFRPTRRRS